MYLYGLKDVPLSLSMDCVLLATHNGSLEAKQSFRLAIWLLPYLFQHFHRKYLPSVTARSLSHLKHLINYKLTTPTLVSHVPFRTHPFQAFS